MEEKKKFINFKEFNLINFIFLLIGCLTCLLFGIYLKGEYVVVNQIIQLQEPIPIVEFIDNRLYDFGFSSPLSIRLLSISLFIGTVIILNLISSLFKLYKKENIYFKKFLATIAMITMMFLYSMLYIFAQEYYSQVIHVTKNSDSIVLGLTRLHYIIIKNPYEFVFIIIIIIAIFAKGAASSGVDGFWIFIKK